MTLSSTFLPHHGGAASSLVSCFALFADCTAGFRDLRRLRGWFVRLDCALARGSLPSCGMGSRIGVFAFALLTAGCGAGAGVVRDPAALLAGGDLRGALEAS